MLTKKYQPKTLNDFFGSDALKNSVRSVIKRDRKDIPHSFLITGESGCGKTALAYILASELGCTEVVLNDNSTDRGIDSIRELQANLNYAPITGKYKMIILDEVHGLTGVSQEALLVTLADAPEHVYFCLCTTEPDKLKITLKRRCHGFEVAPLKRIDLIKLLSHIAKKENKTVSNPVLTKIIDNSNFSPGIAVKYLDMVIDLEESEAISIINTGGFDNEIVASLCKQILSRDNPPEKWSKVKEILKNFTGDPENTRYGIMGYLNKVMLNNGDLRTAKIAACFTDNYYNSKKLGLTLSCFLACHN